MENGNRLKRVILEIEAGREPEAAVKALEERLAAAGIRMTNYSADAGKNAERCGEESGVLYITDAPRKIRQKYGENCCILLYLSKEGGPEDSWSVPYAVETLDGLETDFLEKVYRRHIGAPWEILRTERLIVREMTEADLDALYEIYSGPGMTDYTEGLSEDREAEAEKLAAYIREAYPLQGYGLWLLEKNGKYSDPGAADHDGKRCVPQSDSRQESGRVIGQAGFFWRVGAEYPELGFAVAVPEQGKGYCTEACRAILRYGFEELGFEGVQAVAKSGNEASEHVLRRLGFEETDESGRFLLLPV